MSVFGPISAILDNFSDKENNNVYLQSLSDKKIFTIMKNLNAKLVNKTYKIPIVINLPATYPNTPAEFYIQKKPTIGISKVYYENQKIIDLNSFQINTDKICPFNPATNNLGQIIETLKYKFSNQFPIYANKSSNNQKTSQRCRFK